MKINTWKLVAWRAILAASALMWHPAYGSPSSDNTRLPLGHLAKVAQFVGVPSDGRLLKAILHFESPNSVTLRCDAKAIVSGIPVYCDYEHMDGFDGITAGNVGASVMKASVFPTLSGEDYLRVDFWRVAVPTLSVFNEFQKFVSHVCGIVACGKSSPYMGIDRWPRPNVFAVRQDRAGYLVVANGDSVLDIEPNFKPRALLFSSDLVGLKGVHGGLRSSLVGPVHQEQSDKKSSNPDEGEYCGVERVIPHVLRSGVHRLCGRVHTLLGAKVFYLPLAGFFFAAVAGIGGGLFLDNLNTDRRVKSAGLLLFLFSLPFGLTCLLLGLP